MSGAVIAIIVVAVLLLVVGLSVGIYFAMSAEDKPKSKLDDPTLVLDDSSSKLPSDCNAANCNAAMQKKIQAVSAFGPDQAYKNTLPECAGCPQYSYAWRPDTGLSYTKDGGKTWVACDNDCYNAMKLD